MNEKSTFDAFKLCWDIILQESAKCGYKINSEYDNISDSRDMNFEIGENRLAYIYKYGYFNISFFEKCFLLFINQCSEGLFPFENLKVCSLSNGPGFDIIGLLSALSISNISLKSLPVFNAINVYDSWCGIYKALVYKAYETCIAKSFIEYFHLNQTNINLIQGDVYSALSSEAKSYITNSNVLLMVNVFASSKATPNTFENSLKEIFTLLQPGSLIFYIGSKNSMKLFSKLTGMKQYVKCVCGPQKVTLNLISTDKQISDIGIKPYLAGQAQFVAWQIKDKNLKNIEYEQTSAEYSVFDFKNDGSDVSDSVSELSQTSFMENNDKFNSSIENITSLLSNIILKNAECDEQKTKIWQANNFQPSCSNTSNSVIENITLKEKSSNSLCNNLMEIGKETIVSRATDVECLNTNSNVQLLLQRCDNLISKIEELAVDIKNEFNIKYQTVNKTYFYNQQTAHHHHCCCVKIMPSCCCKKFYKH